MLLVTLSYVYACQRPSVVPVYDRRNNGVGIGLRWEFKRSTEHVS